MTRIAAYTPDLMDRSKISAAANAIEGATLTYVASPEALVGLAGVDVIVVDLAKKGAADVLADIARSPARVIAYGSHVDTKVLDHARAAGCDDVLPRSKFFTTLTSLLTQ